jgi:hypothetical protein
MVVIFDLEIVCSFLSRFQVAIVPFPRYFGMRANASIISEYESFDDFNFSRLYERAVK